MDTVRRISLVLKALRELGPRQLGLYTLYQLGLRTGYLRWRTPVGGKSGGKGVDPAVEAPDRQYNVYHILTPPCVEELKRVLGEHINEIMVEADEIVAGKVRFFGGPAVELQLAPAQPLCHWTDYERGKTPLSNSRTPDSQHTDIKFTWEPARFGWVYTLGRAYLLSGEDRYPETFWRYFETFLEANPTNQGPNWISGQEVALRILAFVFAAQVFCGSPSSPPEHILRLGRAIAAHANRIPPTLIYARAQNNNHLLIEAVGLITAAAALPDHPRARGWRDLGWRWFIWALKNQIAEDGTYVQHSTNYQRLLLQAALWVNWMSADSHRVSNAKTESDDWRRKLRNATLWLLALTDPPTGCVPNLGPNDGAYILPLTVLSFHDHRPVLQAASSAFLGKSAFDPGVWDEMAIWFGHSGLLNKQVSLVTDHPSPVTTPSVLQNASSSSWAYLRVARFTDRPGHADQLHLDLWWRGLNIARDAGTYLYNASPPWDNALTHTAVHNTITVDGREQMTRAGRFLYLDWAQGQLLGRERSPDGLWERIVAQHDGYRRLGVLHQRAVTAHNDGRWLVEDQLLPVTRHQAPVDLRLHWLLPDWSWELEKVGDKGLELRIHSPYGWVSLNVQVYLANLRRASAKSHQYQIVRAGKLLCGDGLFSPIQGWVSPTYGCKIPALSFAVKVAGDLPIKFLSEWRFP
ncbi:MAG: alginate lyase family protein [Chloroflexota bacterium]